MSRMCNSLVAIRELPPTLRFMNESEIAKDQTFIHYLRMGLSLFIGDCVFPHYATTECDSFSSCDNYLGLKLILTFGCFRKLRSENETNAKCKYNAQDERETR